MLVLVPPPVLDSIVAPDSTTSAPMGVCGSMLKPWRGAPGAVDITALFLTTILIAAIENCSGSSLREHGEIMWLNVNSMWGDVDIT